MTLSVQNGLFYIECSIEETVTLVRPNGFLNFQEFKDLLDEEGEWHLTPDKSHLVLTTKMARVLVESRDTHPLERQLRALLYTQLNPVEATT